MAAGAVATLFGQPEIGLPLMLGGAGGLTGGNIAGGKGALLGGLSGLGAGLGGDALGGSGALGSLLGTGGGSSGIGGGLGALFGGGGQAASAAAPASGTPLLGSLGSPMTPAGTLAGQPYYSAADYANYGTGAGGPANAAFFAPPVATPPPAMASAAGGGAPTTPTSGFLSPGVAGPVSMSSSSAANAAAAGITPADLQAMQGVNAAGQSTSTPWYSNPAYWQGAGSVGSAYLKYLSDQKQELAKPFQSAVVNPSFNQVAGVRSSPITPPALVV